ncbi:MAG: NADH:quinone oxidoreductase subunit J [Candidatus Westeberhardia cardiocondylae]|nr:NADH:quinone oxidoreductase subunit J [Candidatus Westeberhardia cardiocondylae]
MKLIFHIFELILIISTINVIIQKNLMYSLLYFILSLLSISCIFFLINCYFIGSLTIIIYAGTIMVLFIFAIMTLDTDNKKKQRKFFWKNQKNYIKLLLPITLSCFILYNIPNKNYLNTELNEYIINEKEIGLALFGGPYFLIIELASMLLLSSLIITLYFNKFNIN